MEVDSNEEETPVNKLVKKAKQLQIDDHDVGEWETVQGSFAEHFHVQSVTRFSKSSGSGRSPMGLFSDLFCDGKTILYGLENGICKSIDLSTSPEDKIVFDYKVDRCHSGLSCARCSKISPHTFFSSSSSEGIIHQWDIRQDSRKPSQKFSTVDASNGSGNQAKVKPILQFDVSSNDQLLCAGTEMVDEDSYLLFWDTRSTKILGAYWESHSDDVTAVKFHPDQVHSLSSGSTDGLLNVFNILEPAEDDALLYSFNTNSSVDFIHWHCSPGSDAKIVCVTHTNDVQVWNTNTGDPIVDINRKSMAEAMLRSNPEAVYITGCYSLSPKGTPNVGVIANSLSGSGNTRLMKLDNEMKPVPYGMFMDQTSVVQTAQYIPLLNQWITFDNLGVMKTWKHTSLDAKEEDVLSKKVSSKKEGRASKSKRYKPYNKD